MEENAQSVIIKRDMKEEKKYFNSLNHSTENVSGKNEFDEKLPLDAMWENADTLSASSTSRRDFLKFLGFSKTIPFSREVYNKLDQEISSVFKDSDLLSPAILKDTFVNIKTRLQQNGWPTINSCLGKVVQWRFVDHGCLGHLCGTTRVGGGRLTST